MEFNILILFFNCSSFVLVSVSGVILYPYVKSVFIWGYFSRVYVKLQCICPMFTRIGNILCWHIYIGAQTRPKQFIAVWFSGKGGGSLFKYRLTKCCGNVCYVVVVY